MKLKTKSYQVTHISHNAKIGLPEHMRSENKMSLSDKLGITVIVLTFFYFIHGVLFPRNYDPVESYAERRREQLK